MKLGVLIAGFAAGWMGRSAVDSSQDVAVRAVTNTFELYERARRLLAIEGEFLEDLLAEGKALFEQRRARASGSSEEGVEFRRTPEDRAA